MTVQVSSGLPAAVIMGRVASEPVRDDIAPLLFRRPPLDTQ